MKHYTKTQEKLDKLCERLQNIADKQKAAGNAHGFVIERGIGLMRHQFTIYIESLDWAQEVLELHGG